MHPALSDHALPSRAVFFVSDSTGITAETLGNALLANFPGFRFDRHTIPFVDTAEAAAAVVQTITGADAAGLAPIVFSTMKNATVGRVLDTAPAPRIDLLGGHLTDLERTLGTTASEQLGQFHTLGDTEAYFARMRAVEYAIEHDDGQSSRALEFADVIIIAPSRCGKTPTTMYLALQYGLLVANYPLTDEDFPTDGLPRLAAPAPEPGAPRATPGFALREPRAMHPRAATRRRAVSPHARAVPELLDQERRGDVGNHPADLEASRLTPQPFPALTKEHP